MIWILGSGGTALSSDVYHIIPADLRLTTQQTLDPLLQVLSPELPTLFIAECVFAYMEPSISSGIMRWFSEHFDIVGGIIYEMFGLDDPFGRVMRDNLKVCVSWNIPFFNNSFSGYYVGEKCAAPWSWLIFESGEPKATLSERKHHFLFCYNVERLQRILPQGK